MHREAHARPTVVLFDLDDTLLDHSGAAHTAARALFAAHGGRLGVGEAAFLERWHALTELAMDAFARGELTVQGQRRMRVREMFGGEHTDAQSDAMYRAYLDVYERSWRLFDDVRPCLARLADKRLGIVTNGGREQQLKKLRSTGLLDAFEVVVTPEPPLLGKPAPAIFHAAANAMGVAPGDCLYVGDHLERDAFAALRAGMHALWLVRDRTRAAVAGVARAHTLADLWA